MPARKQRWQNYRANLPLLSRFILSFTINRLYCIRNDFASRYIRGTGYEIGAQNSPLKSDNADKTIYIDYLSRQDSSRKYNIPENECVEVDIIADATRLDAIPSSSASFIIANHVLEHCPDPIGAMKGWLRILESKGILFLTLPNYKSNEFDFEKLPAPLSHFVQDHDKSIKGQDITTEHIHEHIQIIDGIAPDDASRFNQRYKAIIDSNLHTHYHVFDRNNVIDLLREVHHHTPIGVLNNLTFPNSIELLFIIQKLPEDSPKAISPSIKQENLFNYVVLLKHGSVYFWKRYISRKR